MYPEYQLREKLALEARELDIEAEKGTSAKLQEEANAFAALHEASAVGGAEKGAVEPIVLSLIARRPDLNGLPVRKASDCRRPSKEAKRMQELSTEARTLTARATRRPAEFSSHSDVLLRDSLLAEKLRLLLCKESWRDDTGIPLAVQMLQAEGELVRRLLVTVLADTKGKTASEALARRALFDLSPDLREAAVKALKDRPGAEYRPVLLKALRYPWAPVADHAAEALVNLKAHDMVHDLLRLLDQPDPCAPVQEKDSSWVKPELVRVNHLANCLLCHASSSDRHDLVRGLVPERGKELPVVYYASRSGTFVRADVTYLKQDFSVVQSVPKPDKWPAEQRFDFLIRKRELTQVEVAALPPALETPADTPDPYPQREAVLWALRELTDKDASASTAAWRRLFRNP
jgi:hypothetical protein